MRWQVNTGSRNWYSDSYRSNAYATAANIDAHRQAIRDHVGAENVFYDPGQENGSFPFKLPNHGLHYRLYMHTGYLRFYIGSAPNPDPETPALLNEVQVMTPYGWVTPNPSNSSRSYGVGTFIGEYGFMVFGRMDDFQGRSGYSAMFTAGASLLWNETLQEPDPHRVLVWNGSVGHTVSYLENSTTVTPQMEAARAARDKKLWLRAGIYDLQSMTMGRTTLLPFPVMTLQPFPASLDYSVSQLYGVNAYAPTPPFPEAMLFKRFALDATEPGNTVTVGIDEYWVEDQTTNLFWQEFYRCFPELMGEGQGLLALKV